VNERSETTDHRSSAGKPRPDIPGAMRGRRRWTFALLLLVGFGQAAVAVVWVQAIGSLVDGLAAPGNRTAWLGSTAAVLVGLALGAAGMVAAERVLAEHFGQGWINEVRIRLFEHVARTPVREFRRSTGAVTLRFVGDLTALRRWASLGLAKLAVAAPLILGCLAALVLVSPLVAVAAGGVVLIGLAATVRSGEALRRTSRRARRRRSRVAAHVTEHIGHRLVMQAFGRADAEQQVLHRRGRRLGQAMVRRAQAIGVVRGIGEATTLLATAAALLAASASAVSPGSAAAAIAVVGILVSPVRDLSRVAEYRAGAVVAVEKIGQVLARPVRLRPGPNAPALPPGSGELRIDGLELDGLMGPLSVTAEPGAVVALTGPNGAGKSTLLTVLAGLVPPDRGTVLLDGVDLHTARESDVRGAIGLVTPDLPLLRGTIADNVRYADPQIDGRRLAEAITRSGLVELLADLPDGLDTRVGEGGTGLSAGQRQRVALARALLTGPRMLLLDEADAHLDSSAVGVVDKVLEEYAGTVVLVTHRAEALQTRHTRWHLHEGRLDVEPCTVGTSRRPAS
jgi:ABC-type multidrug transport system fused ATPase/permease subunit